MPDVSSATALTCSLFLARVDTGRQTSSLSKPAEVWQLGLRTMAKQYVDPAVKAQQATVHDVCVIGRHVMY